jgi:hypothetical protein
MTLSGFLDTYLSLYANGQRRMWTRFVTKTDRYRYVALCLLIRYPISGSFWL